MLTTCTHCNANQEDCRGSGSGLGVVGSTADSNRNPATQGCCAVVALETICTIYTDVRKLHGAGGGGIQTFMVPLC